MDSLELKTWLGILEKHPKKQPFIIIISVGQKHREFFEKKVKNFLGWRIDIFDMSETDIKQAKIATESDKFYYKICADRNKFKELFNKYYSYFEVLPQKL